MLRNTLIGWLYNLNRARRRVSSPFSVGARTILLREGQVLLVRHTYRPGWYLPGGGVKKGETIEAAARREAHEEVGASLGELVFFGIYANFNEYMNDHVAVFFSQDFTIQDSKDLEIAEVRFFDIDALPRDISPGTKRRIEEYRAGVERARVGVW